MWAIRISYRNVHSLKLAHPLWLSYTSQHIQKLPPRIFTQNPRKQISRYPSVESSKPLPQTETRPSIFWRPGNFPACASVHLRGFHRSAALTQIEKPHTRFFFFFFLLSKSRISLRKIYASRGGFIAFFGGWSNPIHTTYATSFSNFFSRIRWGASL